MSASSPTQGEDFAVENQGIDSEVAAEDQAALIQELRSSLEASQTQMHAQIAQLSDMDDIKDELQRVKDQHSFISAAKEAVEQQLKEETQRREAAEETVELLRGQVEQARRGVGLLQKQEKDRKRLSQIPIPSFGLVGQDEEEIMEKETSKASKRASFIGRGHRTASTHSEDHPVMGPPAMTTGSPNLGGPTKTGGLRELRLGTLAALPGSATSTGTSPVNGFFDDAVRLPGPSSSSRNASGSSDAVMVSPSKLTAAEEEASRLRGELELVKAQLVESEESREASETVLKALREFMLCGVDGAAPTEDQLKELRLPPLPTDRDNDAPGDMMKEKKPGGWNINKLWRGQAAGPSSPPVSTTVEPPATPGRVANLNSPPGSNRSSTLPLPTPGEVPEEGAISAIPSSTTPLSSFVSGWTKGVVPGTPAERPSVAAGGRKLASFFSKASSGSGKIDEKELPPKPEGPDGEEGLEPSPEIDLKDEEEPAQEGASKRTSGATGLTGPDEVITTPMTEVQAMSLDDTDNPAGEEKAGHAVGSDAKEQEA